jgi:hypothetical protein
MKTYATLAVFSASILRKILEIAAISIEEYITEYKLLKEAAAKIHSSIEKLELVNVEDLWQTGTGTCTCWSIASEAT